MAGGFSRFPEAVMGGKGSIMAIELFEARVDHAEMARLLAAHLDPVTSESRAVEARVRNRRGKACGHVESEIDGVEFDMGDGVEKGGAAFRAAEAAARRLAWRNEPRGFRPSGAIRRDLDLSQRCARPPQAVSFLSRARFLLWLSCIQHHGCGR